MAKKRTHVNAANRYARDVVSGKIAACELVRFSCQRHLNDLKREKQKKSRYVFDRDAGQRVCKFAELMRHVKGKWSGSQIILEPWQCFILVCLFGWKRKSDGLRRFREFYGEIPRKNAKSTLGAIIGLYMFTQDNEGGAEVYSGATTEKQAWEVFRPARLMALKVPGFTSHYGVEVNAKNLNVLDSGSRFEPVIGNPGDGASPHCAIIDEYHEHKTPDLYDTMVTGMGARTQPLRVVITTAGSNLSGPCYGKRNEAVKMLKGEIDNDELFAIIYTIDEEDDWEDFENWKKANPNFGVSVFEDFLRARHREATQNANRQNINRCKHLNQWLNADTAWMDMVAYRKCFDAKMQLEDFRGSPCVVSIDLASKIDLAALEIIFDRGGNIYRFGKYYLPEETVKRPENTHYQTWDHEEWLTVTPGAIIDFEFIETDLLELKSLFEIQEVAYDPFQATQFATRMMAEGFPMIEVGATVRNFSEPMKTTEAHILAGTWHHNGDPVMQWAMSNVVAHTDKKDNIYPNKERPENKIDPVVAHIMGMNRLMAGVEDNEEATQAFVDL
ncbi:MAG: terminase large subunit [Pseudodesulfovibrio sp.]|nr:terminase large subunit [Pseudodesulfovibrio sp.]